MPIKAIADLIMSKLKIFKIPLEDCKGQRYDNGSNMKGVYKGAQAIILRANNEAIYSACTCTLYIYVGNKQQRTIQRLFLFLEPSKNYISILEIVQAPKDGKS